MIIHHKMFEKKEQISITVSPEVLRKIKKKVKAGVFRNQSHAFEYSVQKQIGEAL